MTLWRAFVGDEDYRNPAEPDYRSSLDESGLSWTDARRRLLEELAEDYPPDTADVCGHCAAAAREATEGLRGLPPDTGGQWDVDWDTYALWAVEPGHVCTPEEKS